MDTEVQGAVSTETASEAASQEQKPVAPAVTLDQVEKLFAQRDEQTRRLVQSEADKRVATLDRQLQEERRRRQLLESQMAMPTHLGQDVDPDVQSKVHLAETQRQLAYLRQIEMQRQQEAQTMAFKQQVHEETRQKLSGKGINPDDPRIKYNLDAATPQEYLSEAYLSAMEVRESDMAAKLTKDLEDKMTARLAETEARIRKDTGVDSHDSTPSATSSQQTFTRAQIKDRGFYEKNKEAIDKAAREGRIKKE